MLGRMDSEPKDLIIDVGMHRGEDTEFYLRKGFDVVAIEANPDLVRYASARFEADCASGRLTILHVAVADYTGEVELHLGPDDLWASTDPEMAVRGHQVHQRTIVVPCDTLAAILAPFPTPYYVKIDVEGRDFDCVRSLSDLAAVPRFVSFEANPADTEGTIEAIDTLARLGYRRFKLVNQALNPMHRPPSPPLEGGYVDMQFSKHSSGAFGEESPGSWQPRDAVVDRFLTTVSRQSLRVEYTARGRILGVPVSSLHRPMRAVYNNTLVTRARTWYAARRGIEAGGWFDIHAGL
jgi:FkbM family methyltransferase